MLKRPHAWPWGKGFEGMCKVDYMQSCSGIGAVSTLHLLEHISCINHVADCPQLCSHYLPRTLIINCDLDGYCMHSTYLQLMCIVQLLLIIHVLIITCDDNINTS